MQEIITTIQEENNSNQMTTTKKKKNYISIAGPMFAYHLTMSPELFDFEVGFSIITTTTTTDDDDNDNVVDDVDDDDDNDDNVVVVQDNPPVVTTNDTTSRHYRRVYFTTTPYAAKVVKTTCTGLYEGLYQAWLEFGNALADTKTHVVRTGDTLWEVYRIRPKTTADANQWQTDLFLPIA